MDNSVNDHTTGGGPGGNRHAARYWRIRTAVEIAKFTTWTILYTGWAITQIGWDTLRDLI